MRQILSISLPLDLRRFVDKSVKDGDFSTTSEFFRDLLRERKEREAIQAVLKSEREFKAGGGRRLRSLRSLR